MLMNCIGTFGCIVGRKEDENVICELAYELCINYELYTGNIKFYELISIYCVSWLMWSTRFAFFGFGNTVWEVRGVLNQKEWELGQLSESYVILNPHVFPLACHLYYPFPGILNVYIRPTQWTQFDQVMLYWLWNCVLKPCQRESKTYLFHVTLKALGISCQCDLPHIHLLYNSFR